MPTYEYVCKQCDGHLEVVQSFTEAPLSTCTTCGGSLRKVFGNVGIVFKGSGFYKTDSRAGASGAGTKPASSAASSDAGSAAKGDAGGSEGASTAKGKEPAAAPASGSASASSNSSAAATSG